MKQFELMYEDFSIGMPAHAAEGETFERKNGKYYLKNMNRVFPSFDLRTGKGTCQSYINLSRERISIVPLSRTWYMGANKNRKN